MSTKPGSPARFDASIAPWLSVRDGDAAVAFYPAAFGADLLYTLDDGGKVVIAQLGVGGADFWIQEDPDSSPKTLTAGRSG